MAYYCLLHTKNIVDCAIDVLTTSDVFDKAKKTIEYVKQWRRNEISLPKLDQPTTVPEYPARPSQLNTVAMHEMRGKTRKSLIHSVIHAESFAIDLMWDLIGRFVPWAMPRAFYDDWVRIAGEEASHFLRWVERYAELGGTYGDLPVHDGLWEVVERRRERTFVE